MLRLAQAIGNAPAEPLQSLTLTGAAGDTVSVCDSDGREYANRPIAANGEVEFLVGGALGTHTVQVWDGAGQVVEQLTFSVDARTQIDGGGREHELFALLVSKMRVHCEDYTETVTWRGHTYNRFRNRLLDHRDIAQGMQYFHPAASELAELLRDSQRPDGLIWSFVQNDDGPGEFDAAFGPFGYARRDGNTLFVRWPVDNQSEYLYVNLIHLCWQATGDEAWLAGMLSSARLALEYSRTDRSRWSEEFGLLKRGYTLDRGDVQVQDEHSPPLGLKNDRQIDPDRTKFGIFYGDNTGYVQACEQLAEMLGRVGRANEAEEYRRRADEIRDRLDILVWNGEFFTHRIEEDPNLHRDLGVDLLAQISFSNCYSLNRSLTHPQCRAILETYQDLKGRLPPGSAGEWHTIYPHFGTGFERQSEVTVPAAGELARGAFEHGFEGYGVDILCRLLNFGALDRWAAATAMAALIEGLAGVTDTGAAYRRVRLSPRWSASDISAAAVTVRYAASDGYVAYTYHHDPETRLLTLTLTGSGKEVYCRLLLPDGAASVRSVTSGGLPRAFEVSSVEKSQYAEFTVTLPVPQTVTVQYD